MNFNDLAVQEALSPQTVQEPKPPPPLRPLPGNLPLYVGVPTTTDETASYQTQDLVAPTAASPQPSSSFEALGDNGKAIPPDTNGAVGPNHLMVTLNSQYRIQNRNGGAVSGPLSLESFWAKFGPFDSTYASGIFDPKVVYDPYGKRWIFTALANANTASSSVLIGVSQTEDPTADWNLYKVDAALSANMNETLTRLEFSVE